MEPFAYPSFAAVRAREKTAEEQDLVASLLRRLTELLLERGFFARLEEDETTVTLYSASNDCEMMMTSLLLALHATNQLTDAFVSTPLFIVASSLASRRSSARTSRRGVASYLAPLFARLPSDTPLSHTLQQLLTEELPHSRSPTLFLEALAKEWKTRPADTLFVFFDLCTSRTGRKTPSRLDAPDSGSYERVAEFMRPFFAKKYTPTTDLLHSVLFLLHDKMQHGESLLREMTLLSWLLTTDSTLITAESAEMLCQLGCAVAANSEYSVYSAFFDNTIASALPTLSALPASVSPHLIP